MNSERLPSSWQFLAFSTGADNFIITAACRDEHPESIDGHFCDLKFTKLMPGDLFKHYC